MAFTEDLAVFFDTEDGFAVSATFGAGSTADGIFSNEFIELGGHATTAPVFTTSAAAVSSLAIDAQITVNGTAYFCREKRPDETGSVVVLILEQVS
jgi:hypothetical protein